MAHPGDRTSPLFVSEEEGARLDAEAAQRRLSFLYEATTSIFTAPVDVPTRLQRLAQAVVPDLADWCVVDLIQGDTLHRAAVAHWNPGDAPGAPVHPTTLPITENALVEWAVKKALPIGPLDARQFWEPHIPNMMRALQSHSFIVVPLVLGSQSFGAVTFAFVETMREYTLADIALANDLCLRAAQALENARLFEAEQQARAEAETALRKEADTRARLDMLLARAPIGIGFLSPDLKVVMANEALARMNGMPRDAQLGRHAREITGGLARLVSELERVKETREAVLDLEVGSEPSQGRPGVWMQQLYPVETNGRLVGLGVIAQDVTAQKAADAERGDLLRRLEEAIQARDAFLAVASHDLRSPLAAVLLQAEMLKRALGKGVAAPEKTVPPVEKIIDGVQRTAQLLEELLDVTRIQAGKLTLSREKVDLGVAVHTAVARLEDEAESRGARVELNLARGVVGQWDPLRLDQVVTNLVSNAIKYGAGKPVTVTGELVDGTARLVVQDNGLGIAPEALERIFERFERADTTRSIKGTGVGLWIVKQIVSAHGGTVQVESAVGQGSTFTVELPLRPAG